MPVGDVFLVLAAAAAGGGYLISCAVNPRRPCRHCDGAGRFHDPVFRRAHRVCQKCDGSGWTYRRGARLLRKGRND